MYKNREKEEYSTSISAFVSDANTCLIKISIHLKILSTITTFKSIKSSLKNMEGQLVTLR